MPKDIARTHEVAFCAEVSKWADKIFDSNLALPFGSSDIESFGRGSQKRQDFRVYQRSTAGRGKPALCGEVKLPGTKQGRSPFDLALMQDAFNKATNENCRYFFTWNVEHLALFDRSLWDADSMHERCVGQWKLGLELDNPTDVTRPEVIAKIRDQFLPKFFTEFGDIYLERKKDQGQPPSEFYITVLETHLSGPMGPSLNLSKSELLRVKASYGNSLNSAQVRTSSASKWWMYYTAGLFRVNRMDPKQTRVRTGNL